MGMLKDKLLSFNYYFEKLPLYLQNSYGMKEQFQIWYDSLINVTDIEDEILALLNIFDENYLDYINSLTDEPTDTTNILDKLAALFGFERQLIVTYLDDSEVPAVTVTETLVLNDEEMLMLLKARIIQSYFEGTRKQIIELYTLLGLKVYYVNDDSIGDNATCDVYLASTTNSEFDYSENIKKIFLAGMLNLESMGIEYSFSVIDMERLLIWDKPVDEAYTGWDGGVWSL